MRSISGILILFTLTFFISCGGESQPQTTLPQGESATPDVTEVSASELFFENLSSLCGESFTGESVFPDHPDHELVGVELRAVVESCSDEEIRVPFLAGEDRSRTWVFSRSDRGVHLLHDHRYPDGTPHDLTNYGGYATDEGSEYAQYFAADLLTEEMLPEAETNVWMVEIDPENGTLTYYLERHNEPRFRAELQRDSE
ncbi:MAG TPA: hypothetical protein VK040_07055 [Balneolaceae bacterium]|nr:hypothetical protein [Balneolaceae bacterium]